MNENTGSTHQHVTGTNISDFVAPNGSAQVAPPYRANWPAEGNRLDVSEHNHQRYEMAFDAISSLHKSAQEIEARMPVNLKARLSEVEQRLDRFARRIEALEIDNARLIEKLGELHQDIHPDLYDEPERPHLHLVCSDCDGPDPCQACADVQEGAQATVDSMHLHEFVARMHDPAALAAREGDYEALLRTVGGLHMSEEAQMRIWRAIEREL
ncbi:MAG: hypothetical protein AB7E70_20220 [Hyphomicrobiaceae bacterium]